MTKKRDALKLALEALEKMGRVMKQSPDTEKAIAAIREALAENALDRMADNARELGLDYETAQEPVAYSYTSRITGAQGFSHHPMPRFIDADSWDIKPLYTSPQPAQDQYASEADTEELVRIGALPEPLRLAAMLEKTMQWPLHGKAADCLRKMHAALEKPAQQQEPVCDKDPQGCWSVRCQLGKVCKNTSPQPAQPSKPLPEDYTALEQALTRLQKRYADLEGKASKPLTDAQIGAVAADIWGSVLIAPQSYQAFARAIEAAHGIKEKRND